MCGGRGQIEADSRGEIGKDEDLPGCEMSVLCFGMLIKTKQRIGDMGQCRSPCLAYSGHVPHLQHCKSKHTDKTTAFI